MTKQDTDNISFVTLVQTRLRERGATIKADGHGGAKTREALDVYFPSLKKKAPQGAEIDAQRIVPEGGAGARLYQHAAQDIGLRETAGKGSTARIKLAIQTAAEWLDADDSVTAWCGCIMGLWCKELGLKTPPDYFRAANWKTVGREIESLGQCVPGDIVVMKRSGGHHVALFSSYNATSRTVTLLGGNQSNAVNKTTYGTGAIVAVRRL